MFRLFSVHRSMGHHWRRLRQDVWETIRFRGMRNQFESERSKGRQRCVFLLEILLAITLLLLLSVIGLWGYRGVYIPRHKKHVLEMRLKAHAAAQKKMLEKCQGIDWQTACDALGEAGARRRLVEEEIDMESDFLHFDLGRSRNLFDEDGEEEGIRSKEDELLYSDDPKVTYDEFCLRLYRLELEGGK